MRLLEDGKDPRAYAEQSLLLDQLEFWHRRIHTKKFQNLGSGFF